MTKPTSNKIIELLNNKVASGGWTTGGKILSDTNGETYSDNIFAFTKDGKLQILKSQLMNHKSQRHAEFPDVPEVTFEEFLVDIRELCANNPHYVNILEETDSFISFDLGLNTVPVNLSVIQEPEVQTAFKEYVNYYNNDTRKLKHWDSQTVYYDRDLKLIKVIDFTTVWYCDIRPDRDVNFFGCHDENNLYVFSFTRTFNADKQSIINRLMQMAVDRSLEFKLTYID